MTPDPFTERRETTLSTALLAGIAAHGANWGEEAATHLLIATKLWLRRAELDQHIHHDHAADGSQTAWIDWTALTAEPDNTPASSGEKAILRMVCHLAGHLPQQANEHWTLADILSDLDPTNALLATRAVALAALGPTAVGPLA